MPVNLFKEKFELAVEEAELKARKTFGGYPAGAKWFLIAGILALVPAYYASQNLANKYWLKQYQVSPLAAHPSFNGAKQPRLLDIALTTTGDNNYSVAAILQNENLDLSAKNFSYSFSFFDRQNNAVVPLSGKPSGQSYLAPNQKQYLIIPKLVTASPVALVNLSVEPGLSWQKRLGLPKVNLAASIPKFYQQHNPLAFTVEGNIQNDSHYHIQTARIIFLAYDINKKIVAVSQREEYDLEPNERRAYKQLWPGVLGQNVERVEIIPQTDILNPANLSAPQTAPGPASDLNRQ